MQSIGMRATVPLITYLYADRLVAEESLPGAGIQVPCTDTRVRTDALAVLLVAMSFWSLRRQGVINIAVAQGRRTRRVFPRSEVSVTLLDYRDRPGLEGGLITNMEDDGSVREAISRWASSGSTNPWRDVVREVTKEAVAEGFLRESAVTGGVITRSFVAESRRKPDCGKIAELDEQFATLASSWQEFKIREKLIHDQLCRDCKKALMASTEYWIA